MSSVNLNPTSEETGVAKFIYTDMNTININMQQLIENFLPIDLCQRAAKQVHNTNIIPKHRRQILANNKMVDYSGEITTIGASFAQSQLDAKLNNNNLSTKDYQRISQENNLSIAPQLLEEFDELYKAVIPALETVLGLTCKYIPEFGLPGFHIVYPHTVGNLPRVWHYDDLNHVGHRWSSYFDDFTTVENYFENFYSLTVLIEDPGYTSYDYFPASFSQFQENLKQVNNVCTDHMEVKGDQCGQGNNCVLNQSPPVHVRYRQGDLNLVQGRYLHRLGRTEFTRPEHNRITLQCFGCEKDGVLYLHW
jgi:hypothetical protein